MNRIHKKKEVQIGLCINRASSFCKVDTLKSALHAYAGYALF